MTAIRKGEIQKVTELISSRGLSYWQELLDASDGYDLLRSAVEKQHTEAAKLLLTNGCKVNNENNSPLHFAALNGNVEIVQMLLDRYAEIGAVNLDGATALHYAAQSMNMEIIEMLLSRGANVNAADINMITPVHLAVANNSKEITTLLLSRGANVDGKGNNPRTPQRIAADAGYLPIV